MLISYSNRTETDVTVISATVDAGGYYALEVPAGWSGTVGISLPGACFTPMSRTYFNVVADISGENYALGGSCTIPPGG